MSQLSHPLLNNPKWGMVFGFLVATAYVPGIIGASISTSYFLLMIGLPIILFNVKIPITRLHMYGTCFLFYGLVSLAWTYSFNVGFFILLQMIVLVLAFCYGSCLTDLRPTVRGLALGLGVSAILAIFQKFGYMPVYVGDAPNKVVGLFVNPNMFSETSVILFVSLLVLKDYMWTIVTLPGIIFSHSRAALLALIVCGLIFMWNKSKTFTLLMLPVAALAITAYYLNGSFDVSSIRERTAIWSDTIRGFTFFGNGVGSYEIMLPYYAQSLNTELVIPRYAHNDFLQLVFEFGIGCVLLIPFIKLLGNNNEKYIIYAVGTIAMFSFPLHIPFTAFLFFVVSGYIARGNVEYEPSRHHWRSVLFARSQTQ